MEGGSLFHLWPAGSPSVTMYESNVEECFLLSLSPVGPCVFRMPREKSWKWWKQCKNACVFSLQYEEALTVDTFAGTLLIASHPACALVDTGATHTCMSEEYMSACGLKPEVVSDSVMCVSMPLGPESCMSRVVKDVDVVVEDTSMPVDMLVIPMSDFDVVLGMNWLNKYHVVIDCFRATLNFEVNRISITHELVRPRPTHMPTYELWEK